MRVGYVAKRGNEISLPEPRNGNEKNRNGLAKNEDGAAGFSASMSLMEHCERYIYIYIYIYISVYIYIYIYGGSVRGVAVRMTRR